MRVVGGTWKGRTITAPRGRDTRPTTDRVRESIASSVLSLFELDLGGLVCLDAFAGSGSFGIEMLSRGVGCCTFVDSSKQAVRTIRQNLLSLGAAPASYRVVCSESLKAVPLLADQGVPFGLIFLDPPYAMGAAEVSHLVEELYAAGCAAAGTIAVYERSIEAPPLDTVCTRLIRTKKSGGTAVDFDRMGEDHGV